MTNDWLFMPLELNWVYEELGRPLSSTSGTMKKLLNLGQGGHTHIEYKPNCAVEHFGL